jgi:hypothetical protein
MTALTEAEARATTDALYEWIARYVTMENNTEGEKLTRGSLEEAYREFHRMWVGVTTDMDEAGATIGPASPATSSFASAWYAAGMATTTAGALVWSRANEIMMWWMARGSVPDYFVNLTLDQLLEFERAGRK